MAEKAIIKGADATDAKKPETAVASGWSTWLLAGWRFFWSQVFVPFVHGTIYGMGFLLGKLLVRELLMKRLSIVDYKPYQRPGSKPNAIDAPPAE